MKKFALLMLLGLGSSSVALGVCRVDVSIDPTVPGEALTATIGICCPGQWTIDPQIDVTCYCRTIYVDVYLDCQSRCGCTCEELEEVNLCSKADCGFYAVFVRVWVDYSGCGWPYCLYTRPMLTAIGSDTYWLECGCCNCYPCCCPCGCPCQDDEEP